MSFEFPPLQTERLLLRGITGKDLNFFFRHFSNPEVNRYLMDEDPIPNREKAKEIIAFYTKAESHTYNRWVIFHKADARPIGTCGYHKWDNRHQRAEIGYDLDPASWRKGIMTEALTGVLEFGFNQMWLQHVEALVYPANLASIRILEKLQFQKEGALRSYFRQGGVRYDHWLYSLIKADWCGG